MAELRQYTLQPGARDALVAVFDRELVETQEAAGLQVLGQFRDLERPDRFVWLRGFADAASRAPSLAGFYGGPAWAEHGPAANATMVAWDDVLLLRPAWPDAALVPHATRAARDAVGSAAGCVDITVFPLRRPAGTNLLELARGPLTGCLRAGGALQVAWYVADPGPNGFPRLPIRDAGPVLVGIAVFPDAGSFDAFVAAGSWAREAAPLLAPFLAGAPAPLRLAPTARSATRA
ncbi:MAG: NIPSNAP family protein [Comamonadaceae bacterium]|nr:MAG: NIPSNAP family protein [Comamonadaceae bacterium]